MSFTTAIMLFNTNTVALFGKIGLLVSQQTEDDLGKDKRKKKLNLILFLT